jgi:hypothetical protein
MYLTYVEGQGQVVLCPWCNEPIQGDYALHEYLVKRSAVPKDKQHLIMVPENCIPWHNQSCHIPHGQSKKAARVSLRAAAKRLTARAIGEWYVSLWQEHGLSVPRGWLMDPKKVPTTLAVRFYYVGAELYGFADQVDGSLPIVGDAIAAWRGRRAPAPDEYAGIPFERLVEAVGEGYWLEYLRYLVS